MSNIMYFLINICKLFGENHTYKHNYNYKKKYLNNYDKN